VKFRPFAPVKFHRTTRIYFIVSPCIHSVPPMSRRIAERAALSRPCYEILYVYAHKILKYRSIDHFAVPPVRTTKFTRSD